MDAPAGERELDYWRQYLELASGVEYAEIDLRGHLSPMRFSAGPLSRPPVSELRSRFGIEA